MDLIETPLSELKNLKIKELKKLIIDQKLFEIDKKDKKKDLLKKIENIQKEYQDSESDVDTEMKEDINENNLSDNSVADLIERVDNFNLNKFEKKDNNDYIIFNNTTIIDVCNILKELVNECKIIFYKEGFQVYTIDKYLISLIDIKINNCYKICNLKQEQYEIIINISQILNILDCKEDNQNIKFIFQEDFLEIIFYDVKDDSKYDKMKLHYLDQNLIEEPPVGLNFSFSNNILFDSTLFSKISNKIKKFDDKILFEIDDNNLKLSSKNKLIETNNPLNDNYENLMLCFTLKHILIFCKTEKICKQLNIFFNDCNNPLQLCYYGENCEIKYLITPQSVEDDY